MFGSPLLTIATLHRGVRLDDDDEVAYFEIFADLLRISSLYICHPGRNLAIRYLNIHWEGGVDSASVLKAGYEGHHRPLFEIGLKCTLMADEDAFDSDCVRALGFLSSEIESSRVKMDMRHRREALQDLVFSPDENCGHPDICHRQGTLLWRRWTQWRVDIHYFGTQHAEGILRFMKDHDSGDDSNGDGREMCVNCFEWSFLYAAEDIILLDRIQLQSDARRIANLVYFEDDEE